jgi:hypothetical protein
LGEEEVEVWNQKRITPFLVLPFFQRWLWMRLLPLVATEHADACRPAPLAHVLDYVCEFAGQGVVAGDLRVGGPSRAPISSAWGVFRDGSRQDLVLLCLKRYSHNLNPGFEEVHPMVDGG